MIGWEILYNIELEYSVGFKVSKSFFSKFYCSLAVILRYNSLKFAQI